MLLCLLMANFLGASAVASASVGTTDGAGNINLSARIVPGSQLMGLGLAYTLYKPQNLKPSWVFGASGFVGCRGRFGFEPQISGP